MTQTTLKVRDVSPSDWPALAAQFEDSSYEQSQTYGQAAATRIGGESRFIAVATPDGEPVAAACVRIKRIPGLGRGVAWISAGPMTKREGQPAPTPEHLQDVFATIRADVHASGHLLRFRLPAVAAFDPDELAPVAEAAGFTTTDRAPIYQTVVVDLAPDEDALMKGLNRKWRNHLRNAFKADLAIESGPIDAFADRFRPLYENVRDAKGFDTDIPPEFFYDLAGPDFRQEVLIATSDGQDVGGITIGWNGPNATALLFATDEPGRKLHAGYFLMWEAMLWCRAQGIRTLDLGGIDKEANPTVTRFKTQTGGQDLTAPGPWEARAPGIMGRVIDMAESLHGKLKAGQ